MGIAALVLGIIGTLCSMNPWLFWIGIPLSVLALVLGIVESKRAQAAQRPSGPATAGLILGIVGCAIGVLVFSACAYCASRVNKLSKELENLPHVSPKTLRSVALPLDLGEPAAFPDSVWVVKKARDMGPKIGDTVADGHFVMVTFKVQNLGKTSDMLFDLPPVIDGKGQMWKPYAGKANLLPDGARSLVGADLPPGIMKEFSDVYDVPVDADDLRFRARALEAGGSTREVRLSIEKPVPKAKPRR